MVNLHYIPVHTQPYYEKMGFKRGTFPEAERYYEEAISLPMYFGLSDEEQDYVVEKLREVLVRRKG
jgi:dTDP-4-amino-4,6-dideoxygalactose transaminase